MSASSSIRAQAEEAFFRFLSAEGKPENVEAFVHELSAELHGEFRRILEDYRFLREALQEVETLPHGKRLGEFELIREIGRGGMGVVWEAQQLSLDRRVALKVFPRAGEGSADLRRFLREAQAGGRIRHPGIVPVFAVGEHEDIHFIVQELVPGGRTLADRIRELREAPRLPEQHPREAAELVASVAEALAAAHAEGVLHRDVKPANVLLDPSGRARVTDFGIARIRGAETLTTRDLAGTPSYMSPEQVAGARVDERSDVFGLGVTLFELLTLSRPFQGDTSQEILQKILHIDPPDPRALRRRIPRDLAVICLHALEKSPRRRYPSMEGFAQDLRRFLRHEPIRARPPGPAARAAKWAQRHPVLSASGSVAALLFAVIVVLFVRAVSAERSARAEARRASAEAQTATRVKDLLVELFRASDPEATRGLRRSPEEILAEGVERVRSQLTDEPRVRADLLYELGRVHAGMGRYPEALSFLQESRDLQCAELGERHPKALAARVELARVEALGFSRLDSGIAELERTLADIAAADLGQSELALTARAELGWLLKKNAEFDRAEPHLRSVLEQRAERHGPLAPETLSARSAHADLLLDLGRHDEAEAALRELVEDVGSGGRAEDQVTLALAQHNLARCLVLRARPGEAHVAAQAALELSRAVFGADHPQTLIVLGTYASCSMQLGALGPAARAYEEILAIGPRVWGETHEALRHAHTNLGILCYQLGREDDMLAHQAAAVEQAEHIFSDSSHRTVLRAKTDQAAGLMEAGRADEAQALFEEVLPVLERALGIGDALTLQTRINYALLLRQMHDENGAVEILSAALADCREHLDPGNALTLRLLFELGSLQMRRGELAEAELLFDESLAGWREHHAQVPGAAHGTAYQLTEVYLSTGRLDEAARLLRQELDATVPGSAAPLVPRLLDRLGEVELRRGRWDDAEAAYRRLLAGAETLGDGGRAAAERARSQIAQVQLERDAVSVQAEDD